MKVWSNRKLIHIISLLLFIFAAAQIINLLAKNADFLLARATTYPTFKITVGFNGIATGATTTITLSGAQKVWAYSVGGTALTAVTSGSNSVLLSSLVFNFNNVSDSNIKYSFNGYSADFINWSANIDTTAMANGNYNFYARGFYNGVSYESNSVGVYVKNSSAASLIQDITPTPTSNLANVMPTSTPTATLTPTPKPVPLAAEYPVITSGLAPTAAVTEILSGAGISVWASSTLTLTGMNFYFFNTTRNAYAGYYVSGTTSDYKNWSAVFDTTKLDNGSYNLIARGYYNNNLYTTTTPAAIYINNSAPAVSSTPTPTSVAPNSTPTPTPTPAVSDNLTIVSIDLPVSPLSGDTYIYVKTSQTVDSVVFKVISADGNIKDFNGINTNFYYYYFVWPTSQFSNGNYVVKAITKKETAEISASYNFTVMNGTATATPAPASVAPPEAAPTTVTPEPIVTAVNSISTAASNPAGLTITFVNIPVSPLSGSVNIYAKISEMPESVVFKIEGQKYLEPAVFKSNDNLYYISLNAADFPSGNYAVRVIAKKDLNVVENKLEISIKNPQTSPVVSSAGNGTKPVSLSGDNNSSEAASVGNGSEGPAVSASITAECRQQNILDKEKCKEYMFKYAMPAECGKKDVKTQEQCSEIILASVLPKECLEVGFTTASACQKYLLEKRGSGASGNAAQNKYLPEECQAQGLSDPGQCDVFLKQKYMPEECRKSGAKSESDCNEMLFKKIAPAECQQAGIENEKECKDFIFNLYAAKVTCDNADDWQCKSSLKDRHLGDIVVKQAEFDKIKETVVPLVGETVKIGDLKNKMGEAEAAIPVEEPDASFKVIAARSSVIIDSKDDVIQTAPVALMIDSDKDGLPDDVEKRLGTDPNKADTDGDGYPDGEEVRNGYNPLGPGKADSKLSPVEQAIIANQALDQPKVQGKTSDDFKVESVVNRTDGQNNTVRGYIFSGKAQPDQVVTLYIYSDLPLVATVRTDKSGNWNYEFDKSLTGGAHEVYVALNDNTGKVVDKSQPMNFFVQEAKAVSVKDFVAASVGETSKKSDSLIYNYLAAAVLFVVIGIALYVTLIRSKKKGI